MRAVGKYFVLRTNVKTGVYTTVQSTRQLAKLPSSAWGEKAVTSAKSFKNCVTLFQRIKKYAHYCNFEMLIKNKKIQ